MRQAGLWFWEVDVPGFSRVLGQSDQRGGGNGGFLRSAQLRSHELSSYPADLQNACASGLQLSSHHCGCRVNLLPFS